MRAKKVNGLSLVEFRRKQPEFRQSERFIHFDVVYGYWLAQANPIVDLDVATVRKLAIQRGLDKTRRRPIVCKGRPVLGAPLSDDFSAWMSQLDLERPILFITDDLGDGATSHCLIDGHHRLYKACTLKKPLRALMLSPKQSQELTRNS